MNIFAEKSQMQEIFSLKNRGFFKQISNFISKNKTFIQFFLAFLGGIFFGLGFEPFNFILSSFFGLFIVYYLLSIENIDFKNILKLSGIFISSYVLFSLHWIFFAPLNFESFKIFAPFGVILMIIYFYFYFSIFLLFFLGSQKFLKKFSINKINLIRPILFSIFFIFCLEFLRIFGIFAFPWNLFGSIFIDYDFSVEIIKNYGIFIFGFLIILFFSLIFEIILLIFQKKYSEISFIILLILFLGVFFLFNENFKQKLKNPSNKVFFDIEENDYENLIGFRLVSTNIKQKEKWKISSRDQNIIETKQITFSENNEKIKYFIWPETSFPIFIDIDENNKIISNQYIQYLSSFLSKDQFLILGALLRQKYNNKIKAFNSIITIDHLGNVVYLYKKRRLVPFGEFIPFLDKLDFLNLESLSTFQMIKKGPKEQSCLKCVEENGYSKNFYPLICFEAIFPFKKNQKPEKNIDFILNLSNDAWFDKKFASAQHLRMVRIRAIESEKPLLRVTNSGFSAFIDKNGKIIKKTDPTGSSFIDFYINQ